MKKSKVILGIFTIIAFLTMMYQDILETSTKSYLLLDSIFIGVFPVGYPFESAFYIPVHIAFAIWNFPLWVLYRFNIGDPSCVFNLLYAKLLIVLSLFAIIVIFRRILDEAEYKGDKNYWSMFLLTSLLIFPPVFDMSQYDCIGLAIGLYGTLLAIRSDDGKLSWKSLLFLSIASSFKMLYLFAAICIIFIKTNKFKNIIINLLFVFVTSTFFIVLSKILASTKQSVAIATNTVDVGSAEISVGMLERLFKTIIPGGMYDISICFLCMFAVFFLIFLNKKQKSKKEQIYDIAFYCSAIYLSLMIFALAHPQWSVFPAIFLVLLLALSEEKYTKRNLICNEIFECSLLLQQIDYYYWVYLNENGFNYLILKDFNNYIFNSNLVSAGTILRQAGDYFGLIVSALMIIAVIVILFNNNPYKKLNVTNDDNNKIIKSNIMNFRVIIIATYVICGLIIRLVL